MPYKYLGLLHTFFPSDQTCNVALKVVNKNISVNCLGGTINSTNTSIDALNADNLLLENCRIKGNAINAMNSKNISIYNSTIIANNATNIPYELNSSSLFLYKTSILGYSRNGTLKDNSTIRYYNSSIKFVTTTIDYNSTQVTSTMVGQSIKTYTVPDFLGNLYAHMLELFIIFIFLILLLAGIYMLLVGKFKQKSER